MILKRNKSKWIVPLLLLSTITNASETNTCTEVIKAADLAITSQKAQIEVRDQELTQTQKILDLQTKEIDSLRRDAWYQSPWLWLTVGVLAGAYATKK